MRQLTTCLIALSTLAACGGEDAPSPTEVRTAIHSDLAHVLTEAQAASDGTIEKLPSTDLFQSFLLAQTPSQLQQWLNLARSIPTTGTAQYLAAESDDEGFDVDAVTKMLEEQVFTDANYVGDGIYRVPASLMCEDDDADCAADFAKAQMRIRVANDADAVEFFLQVDKNHDEPLSVSLSHERLAITLNLDEASDAMIALGEASTTAKLSGSVTGSLTILGAAHAKLAVDFDRALSVELDDMKFASAAAHVLSIDLDPNASKAALSVALGETTAHIPGDSLDPRSRDFDLAGLTGDATFDGTTLALSNLSLGNKTSFVKVDGIYGATVDLNVNDGRKLNATITKDTIKVSPRFELAIDQNHEILGDEAPLFDITKVLLTGSIRAIEETGAVKVLDGTFALETNPAEYGFSAAGGQCVTPDGEHFTVANCN